MNIGIPRLLPWLGLSLLTACSGNYDGGTANNGGGPTEPTEFANVDEFYKARVEPTMSYCVSCHVSGGVADTPEGERMHLSTDRSQDMALLRASWEAMDRNNPVSRILLMSSGQADPHSGGSPWPQSGNAYRDMRVVLSCFENPDQCMQRIAEAGGGVTPAPQPLLGSNHGSSFSERYCEGPNGDAPRPDATVLPTDPRKLIKAGYNSGKAVFFNAYWEDCRADLPVEAQEPKTCGEYRAKRDAGWHLMSEGFADNGVARTAAQWREQWREWGLTAEPANFDEVVRLRTGRARATYHNPYPLPGEDPNAPGVNGGSGELPFGFRQRKDAAGNWTGMIGTTNCASCHVGEVGTDADGEGLGTMYGVGNSITYSNTLQRGQSDAVTGFEILQFVSFDWDSIDSVTNFAKYPATHMPSLQDTPSWWNTGSRSRKFFDGGVAMDSLRIDLAAASSSASPIGRERRAYIDRHAQSTQSWVESLKSPAYPREIDTALAEQGAILFHAKNLWLEQGNASRPRPPGGNGSCASCHGAYSPQFVNDPEFLVSPDLAGIAASISPKSVIETDTNRADQLAGIFADVWETSWWAYPEGSPAYIDPDTKTPEQERADDTLAASRPMGACGWRPGTIGYLAPPLHGVWASAPYFHNGTVPTVEAVLDSSKRPDYWRRKVKAEGGISGFDTSLDAYDFEHMGWKHDVLACIQDSPDNFTACVPYREEPTIAETASRTPPLRGPSTPDTRMIVNTKRHANGNGGHEFSDVLTDAERRAIIEYMKTL
jgi:mono/diheme cytochrome c family protein